MKGKIIITNDTNLSDAEALSRVLRIVQDGRVSADGSRYCFLTLWNDDVVIYADLTRTGTDTFCIKKEVKR